MDAKTPLYDIVKEYAGQNKLRAHMPGHIGGKGFFNSIFKEIGTIDITEITDIGDIHVPEGKMEEARRLLADAFGARESLFLVNGASSGVQAAFLSIKEKKRSVLIPRYAHRSFYSGLVLSGCRPEYINQNINAEFEIMEPLEPAVLIENVNDGIEGIFLTSPDYFGIISDTKEICTGIKNKKPDALIFVDEANGAHFAFNKQYPIPAIQAGADIVVNGLHKTLPVLNQGACLHAADEDYFRNRLYPAWSLVTTTSPSFPIIASIDWARSFMLEKGKKLLDKALEYAGEYRNKINAIKGISVFGCNNKYRVDPLRVLIGTKNIKLTGYEIEQLISARYGIQLESQGPHYIMALMSIFHIREDWERLYNALLDISRLYYQECRQGDIVQKQPQPVVVLTPREAFFSCSREVKFMFCKDKIAAEMVAPYPPGVPCLLPGELIHEDVFEYMLYLKNNRIPVHGPVNGTLETIRIIDI